MKELIGWHLFGQAGLTEQPDKEAITDLLNDLVAMTGLTPIKGPEFFALLDTWQAFVVIAESHISLHGDKGTVFFDVFSCRAFDGPAVLQQISAAFNIVPSWSTGMRIRRCQP